MNAYYLTAVNAYFKRLPEFFAELGVDFKLRCCLTGLRMKINVDYSGNLTKEVLNEINTFTHYHRITMCYYGPERKTKIYAVLDFPYLRENQDQILPILKLLKSLGADLMVKYKGRTIFSCLIVCRYPDSFISDLLELLWDHPEITKWRKTVIDSIIQQMFESKLISQMSEYKKNALFQIFTGSEIFERRLIQGSLVPDKLCDVTTVS